MHRHVPLASLAVLSVLTLAACGGGEADPADYPDDDITLVVPFAAGGPTDTVTRLIAEPMAEELGQEIIVKNVEGAGGTVAAGQVAHEVGARYNLLGHPIGLSPAPPLNPDQAHHPHEDFKTVGLVTDVPMTIVARSDFEPETLEELATYVEENADTVTLANAGVGAASHLCGLLIEQQLGIDLTEVPYDGTGPAMTDLLGGQVDFMCDQTTNTAAQIKAEKIKAYAVTTPEPVEALSDLPTTADAGWPDVEVGVWHGLYVPADTPDEIVEKLTAALEVALQDQGVIDQMADLGTTPVPADQVTPEAHTTKLEEQIDLWTPVIEEAGVTGE